MSSTEIAVSPKKKSTKQKMDQIVSSSETNGHNLLDNTECSNDDKDDEAVNDEQTLITNTSETNKDEVDECMEPLLLQNSADEVSVNQNNETNCVLSGDNSLVEADEFLELNETPPDEESPTDQGGGGFIKSNLSLNLSDNILSDDKNMPKNKKFLESSDDQIINQIFFSTISVTPTADDDILDNKFVSNDNTPITPSDVDPELLVGAADFFNRKIDEDDTFDTTFTDATENYQENDGNLCSLTDNFNENYCSFSSVDYNTDAQQQKTPENPSELLQPDTFLGDYAEIMRQQRPSIVIDCYDSDSNSDKNSQTDDDANVVVGEAKINDYCFYFDQTIEEDDDDACFLNIGSGSADDDENLDENGSLENKAEAITAQENGKLLEEVDECFETEEEIFNDEDEEEELPNECDDDKSLASDEDDEGVINESCLSVNVSRHKRTWHNNALVILRQGGRCQSLSTLKLL